jgi:hypothetical protein
MKIPKDFMVPITGMVFLDKDDQEAQLAEDEMVEYIKVYPSDENIVALNKKGYLVAKKSGEAHITVVVKVSSMKGNRYIRSFNEVIVAQSQLSSFGVTYGSS